MRRLVPWCLLVFLMAVAAPAQAAAPTNDRYDRPVAFSTLPYHFEGSLDGATREATEPDTNPCQDPEGGFATPGNVWFRYTAKASGAVRAEVTMPDPAALWSFVLATDGGETLACQGPIIVFQAVKGVSYRFAVDGDGAYALDVTRSVAAVANDNRADAMPVHGSAAVDQDMERATREAGEDQDCPLDTPEGPLLPSPGDGIPDGLLFDRTAWFLFTGAAGTVLVDASTPNPPYWGEPNLNVYEAGSGTLVACDDAGSAVQFPSAPGVSYLIQVGWPTTSGPAPLHLVITAPEDPTRQEQCEAATGDPLLCQQVEGIVELPCDTLQSQGRSCWTPDGSQDSACLLLDHYTGEAPCEPPGLLARVCDLHAAVEAVCRGEDPVAVASDLLGL